MPAHTSSQLPVHSSVEAHCMPHITSPSHISVSCLHAAVQRTASIIRQAPLRLPKSESVQPTINPELMVSHPSTHGICREALLVSACCHKAGPTGTHDDVAGPMHTSQAQRIHTVTWQAEWRTRWCAHGTTPKYSMHTPSNSAAHGITGPHQCATLAAMSPIHPPPCKHHTSHIKQGTT